MKQTRERDKNTNNISEKDKDCLDENDKMNMDHKDIRECKNKQYNEKGNATKQEYFEESCGTVPDEESLKNTESVQKHNGHMGQERIKVNFDSVPFDSLNTIDPELENGLKGLSVSRSTSIDNNGQQVKSNGAGNEMEAMENETNKREGINCDRKEQTTDIGDGGENVITTTEGEDSQVNISYLFSNDMKTVTKGFRFSSSIWYPPFGIQIIVKQEFIVFIC